MGYRTKAEQKAYLRALAQQYKGTFKLRKLRSDINKKRRWTVRFVILILKY